MTTRSRLAPAALLLACCAALAGGCGAAATVFGDGGVGDGGAGDGPDAALVCSSNAECGGGVCVGGSCCPTAEQVCGTACCAATDVCFASACVSPGGVCFSTHDCPAGEYCEPALGPDRDGGVATVDAGVCLLPAPAAGRCLALPPTCADADGGVPGCVPPCEYHPPAGGPLTAVVKWQWGPVAAEYPDFTDVWATPTVGRVYDTNCDGQVDELDPPNVVFVAGNARSTCCSCGGFTPSTCLTGVLRMLDGLSGQEIWSLRAAAAGSIGFAGLSVAIGDLNGDGRMEIAAVTGEGYVALVDATGQVLALSDQVIAGHTNGTFGWGGGLALADMDGDGNPEIAYGATVFTVAGGTVTRRFVGTGGIGGANASRALSVFADLDGADPRDTELLGGRTAYKSDGSILWDRTDLPDGFPAVGNLDRSGGPETVLVANGQAWILDGLTGATVLGPVTLGGTGAGGPPTIADFDGDGELEIGVAQQDYYTLLKPHFDTATIAIAWSTPNHDLSSSITGSTVFDFEGDGAAEVIYNDECFLWVYDGQTGAPRFAAPTTSFTATEASLVADLDGDGHAEMLMISNGADPSASGWKCDVAPWNQPDLATGRPAWQPPAYGPAYRGITVFGDSATSWVGTRTLWNQHSYHVTNICDHRDDACGPPNVYGSIPAHETNNWEVPWLNNFRQNVQDQGIFNAPDAVVTLTVDCTDPLVLHAWLRNLGSAILPAGVNVGFSVRRGVTDQLLGTATSPAPLFPGQVAELVYTTQPTDGVALTDAFTAAIIIDPQAITFHECRTDNNVSAEARAVCVN